MFILFPHLVIMADLIVVSLLYGLHHHKGWFAKTRFDIFAFNWQITVNLILMAVFAWVIRIFPC